MHSPVVIIGIQLGNECENTEAKTFNALSITLKKGKR